MNSGGLKRRITATLAAAAIMLCCAASVSGGGAQSGGGDPVFPFTGRGRAHGVGMCMDGVYYRALDGYSYHDIIRNYYTGIGFGRSDDGQPVRVKCRDGRVRVYPMKQYLYRLTEEPESYPFEGLKVLYVAARTYTLSCIARGKHAKEGFDICPSGNCCQAFDENKDLSRFPRNCAAVDATTGEVILHGGKVITAAYCGSCGGHSENNEDVWGSTPIPYLRGRPDTYCNRSPRYAWSVPLRKSEVEARLNAFGDTQIGSVYAIEILSRTPGGRVARARLSGSLGTKVVSGSTLSARLGLPSSLFFLAHSNFDQYILILNPNEQSTVVTFTFMRPDGEASDQIIEVAGNSRFTLKVNDYAQFQEVSTRVISELPVVAERAMYFNYQGRVGGSASTGADEPSDRWYFAEGYTGGSFDTYILVQNPQPGAADVRFTFMVPGGRTVEKTVQAKPYSRTTVRVDDVPGLAGTEVSTLVESTNGEKVVAERSMYFDYSGLSGGNSECGVTSPSDRWYLAEGYTGGRFDTYILLQNPSAKAAEVAVTFMKEDGSNIVRSYELAPRSRFTIEADGIEGLQDAGFSTRAVSRNRVPIVAERSVFFDYNGLAGGHDGRGVAEPAEAWYFAEGYTGGRFDTYLLVQNPNPGEVRVQVTFTKPSGRAAQREYSLKPKSRLTIPVDRIEGLENTEISTTVRAPGGEKVIAERAMYFSYENGPDSRGGGHDTAGVTKPSTRWFFAEGYTGY